MPEIQSTLIPEPENLPKVLAEVKRLTYPQEWTSYNQAKTKERLIAENLLLELLDYIEIKKTVRRGRKPINLKERVYSMFLYNYSGYSSRRCISELKIAEQRKLITKTPHFNSLLNYYSDFEITELLKKLIVITALPLKNIETDFAVDSSGFSTSLYDRWLNVRTQKVERRRHWKKCHTMIGTKTNVITSVPITEGDCGDSPEFLFLARETRGFFNM